MLHYEPWFFVEVDVHREPPKFYRFSQHFSSISSHLRTQDLSWAYQSIRYIIVRCLISLLWSSCNSLFFGTSICVGNLGDLSAVSSAILHLILVACISSQADNFTTATINRTQLDTDRKKMKRSWFWVYDCYLICRPRSFVEVGGYRVFEKISPKIELIHPKNSPVGHQKRLARIYIAQGY